MKTVKQILEMVYGSTEMQLEVERKLIQLKERASNADNDFTNEVLRKVLLEDAFYIMNRDLEYKKWGW